LNEAPGLELEDEARLISEVTLMVIAGGEVTDEARQKIICFDRADRQVRSDFNIEPSPKHYIQRPIATGAERASGAILVNIWWKLVCAPPTSPSKKGCMRLMRIFICAPKFPVNRLACGV
jgi:hypothetical protein